VKGGKASFAGQEIATANAKAYKGAGKKLELGVRPEFVSFANKGIPVDVVKVADAGRFRIVETRAGKSSIKLLVPEGNAIPEGKSHLAFDADHTQVYENGWIVGTRP
jgi:glycerol transport system ATP-binding protein